MKTQAALLGAAAVVAFATPADAARLTGWYGVFEGGQTQFREFDLAQSVPPAAPVTSVMETEVGWAALATLGYAHDDGMRVELEGGYRINGLRDLTLGAVVTPQNGDLSQFTLMVNFLYDFKTQGPVGLALGAGVGADYGRLDGPSLTNPILDRDLSIAYQGIVGLSWRANDWLDMVLNYRFLFVPDFKFEQPLVAPNIAHADPGRLFEHMVTLGFRFGTHQQQATPMLAPVAPPPPPAPPPIVRKYVVFFGFGKCNITAEADTVLTEAASAARRLGAVSVKIVGHTDSVGSQAANQRLSECRATAAKSNLVGKGIPDASIATSGAGESELIVQTGDNVKEPQNRRATVDLE